MKTPLGNIMKQAQAMQENLKKAQDELAQIEVTGGAGGGLVEVTMTCRHDIRRVSIDDALILTKNSVCFHAPVEIITRPVMVQMINVSI